MARTFRHPAESFELRPQVGKSVGCNPHRDTSAGWCRFSPNDGPTYPMDRFSNFPFGAYQVLYPDGNSLSGRD